MAAIVLTDDDVYTVPERIETGVVMAVVLFLTYLLLLFSDAILRVIGRQGASVLVRVMGLILCSLAVEIVLTALGVGPWTRGGGALEQEVRRRKAFIVFCSRRSRVVE